MLSEAQLKEAKEELSRRERAQREASSREWARKWAEYEDKLDREGAAEHGLDLEKYQEIKWTVIENYHKVT